MSTTPATPRGEEMLGREVLAAKRALVAHDLREAIAQTRREIATLEAYLAKRQCQQRQTQDGGEAS